MQSAHGGFVQPVIEHVRYLLQKITNLLYSHKYRSLAFVSKFLSARCTQALSLLSKDGCLSSRHTPVLSKRLNLS